MSSLDYEVIIVGAGVAGASAAFHLYDGQTSQDVRVLVVDAANQAGMGKESRRSGSAVMEGAAATVKMMVQVFAGRFKNFRFPPWYIGSCTISSFRKTRIGTSKANCKEGALSSR